MRDAKKKMEEANEQATAVKRKAEEAREDEARKKQKARGRGARRAPGGPLAHLPSPH